MSGKKKRLADVLIKNLTEFRDDLRAGTDIAKKYTVTNGMPVPIKYEQETPKPKGGK